MTAPIELEKLKKPFNPLEVRLKKGESIEKLIKRFSKKVDKDGIIDEVKDRTHYKKPSLRKKEKKKERKRVLNKLKEKRESN